MIKKLNLLFSFLLVMLYAGVQAKTNVVIILVDDMGYSDLGCYGGEIKTPVLDSLADNGLRYTQFYNTARCWPTRAAMTTGYYAQQVNFDKVLDLKLTRRRPSWAQLFPKYIKKKNYRSYHSGKWHLDGMPLRNGFDRSYYLKDQGRFFSPTIHFLDDKKLKPVKKDEGFYGTTAIANHAINFLKDHENKHKAKPFFAYFAFTAPHFPLHALPEDIKKVGDRYKGGWDKIREERWKRLVSLGIAKGELPEVEKDLGPPYHFPDHLKILGKNEVNRPVPWESLSEQQKLFQESKMVLHAAMIERMDFEIGRIIEQLKQMKVFEDTLILFLSDNGASAEIMVRSDGHDPKASPGSAESYLCLGPGWSSACNTPFRKHKTWVHEGGACTAMIAHWPKGINARGEFRHTPAHVIDVVPSLLELCDVKLQKQKVPFPGKSFISTFEKDYPDNRTLWWSHEGHHALRHGDWKLVKVSGGNWELYNLKTDRNETKDVSNDFPEKVKEMEKMWMNQVSQFRKDRKVK